METVGPSEAHEIQRSPSLPSTITVDSDVYSSSTHSFSSLSETLNVKNIFMTDVIGAALVEKSKNSTLSNKDRDRISDILITCALNKYKRLDHIALKRLANDLVIIFPNEKVTTYFVDPIKKCESSNNRSERARGKLVEKYRNRLHLLKTITENSEKKETTGK